MTDQAGNNRASQTNCMRYILYGCIALLAISCSKAVFKSKWTAEKAPSAYTVRFETSKGRFDIRVTREWSPLAADRFYQLVKRRFYDSAVFYRVVPNFVAQFGNTDYTKIEKWMEYKIADEEVLHSNKKGSLSFARSGKQTRGDALYINLKDNPRLDTINFFDVKGFPSFGEVVNGMDVVSALYSGYGDTTMSRLDVMYENRGQFLQLFPGLDVIRKAYILKKR